MKNGFYKGFIDIPSKKYYKYHGLIMPCNIQPDPEPLIKIPLVPAPAEWVLIYDEWPVQNGQWLLKYNPDFIKPSSIGDPCFHSWPDGKQRYYFFEVDYYWNGLDKFWTIRWSDGLNCAFDGGSSSRAYMHFEFSKLVWFGWDIWEDYLIYLENPAAGTNVKIWASTTGELPADLPSPEGIYW